MRNIGNVLWGIVLILIGVIIGVNALGIADISIFFDGWWTLFIIIPCLIDLFQEEDKTGSLIGLAIGVILFLCCQDFFDFEVVWKLLVPFVLIAIGLSFIFKDVLNSKVKMEVKKLQKNKNEVQEVYATFSSQKLNYQDEEFVGCDLTAVFGGIECDLRNSIISSDAIISASSIFGGIDIYVPDDVIVKVTSNSVFGGVTNKVKSSKKEGKKTIYIQATCVFGGVEIK